LKKRVIAGAVTIGLLCSGGGVYAGTVISQYKTVRGNIATVEKEEIHKNRIAIQVNGKKIKSDSWYANQTTYVPLREVSNLLGAGVVYDSKTMTAKITKDAPVVKPPTLSVINKSDLPYTIKAKNGMQLTVNSYTFNSSEVVFNLTLKNNSTTSDKGSLMTSTWEAYDGKTTLEFVDQDRLFWDTDNLRAGQSVTGNVTFNGLSQQTNTVSLFGSLWQYIDAEDFKLTFKNE
jgi:hypothetical protein